MTPKPLSTLLAGLLVAFLSTAAAAAPDESILPAAPDDRDATAAPEPAWYGYKLLIADAASLGLLVAGMSTDAPPLAVPGLAGMFLAAPGVHLAQGEGGRALGSLGLRLVLPLAGGFLGGWLHDRGHEGDPDMGGAFAAAGGMALGLLGAMLVDAAFVGWRSQPVAERSVAVLPTLALTPNGGSLGLAGRF